MTRTYILRRLMEHGPLTLREIVEITGWPPKLCWNTVHRLLDQGVVVLKSAGVWSWRDRYFSLVDGHYE